MKISENCREMLLNAEGKALATYSSETGVHVVPVSSIRVEEDKIILVNYFFGATLRNINYDPHVALSAWIGLKGYQIKGTVVEEKEGERYEAVVKWIEETIPGRVVKSILVLTPMRVFDVSAGLDAGKEVFE